MFHLLMYQVYTPVKVVWERIAIKILIKVLSEFLWISFISLIFSDQFAPLLTVQISGEEQGVSLVHCEEAGGRLLSAGTLSRQGYKMEYVGSVLCKQD